MASLEERPLAKHKPYTCYQLPNIPFHVFGSDKLSYYTFSLANFVKNNQAMAMAPLELTQVQEYSKEWL